MISRLVTLGTEANQSERIEISWSMPLGTEASQPEFTEISRPVTLDTEVRKGMASVQVLIGW